MALSRPATDDPVTILNWYRLDDRLTTSGQPTEAQLPILQGLGVRHVINLGLHSHEAALPDEAASLAMLGIAYIHLPVDFHRPTETDYELFCAVMRRLSDETVHVHCIMNWRVSAFLYRYRRDQLGVDDDIARADMEALWQPDTIWTEFITNTTTY